MRIVLSIIFLLALSSGTLYSAPSAIRYPHESFEDAASRNNAQESDLSGSAYDQAVRFENLDINRATEWSGNSSPVEIFHWIRDKRFLRANTEFPRRLSWLYPDDGCFARAELMRIQLEANHSLSPTKLFIFGDLNVQTNNHPDGIVSWWYHVVPAFRIGHKLFVFDPAIDSSRPLLAQEWFSKMLDTRSANFKVALCEPKTYGPYDSCANPTRNTEVQGDILRYLEDEWNRLLEMQRNPHQELRDFPPWRTPSEMELMRNLTTASSAE